MASSEAIRGLFGEIGLGPINESQLFDQAIQRNAPQGTNNAALFAQLGQQQGAQAGLVLGGVAKAAGGLITGKDGGRSIKGAVGNLFSGATQVRETIVASELGQTPEEFQRRKRIRKAVQNINVESSGDPIADQIETLRQIIQVATSSGDMEIVAKAMAKMQDLKRQAAELDKVEAGTASKVQATTITGKNFIRDTLTGVDVVPFGVDPTAKGFLPSSAIFDFDTNSFTLFHPDKTVETGVDHVQKFDAARASNKLRVSDKLIPETIQQAGGGKNFSANRQALKDMARASGLAREVADFMVSLADPQAITGLAGKSLLIADKGIRALESLGSLTFGATGDGSYRSEDTGVEFKNDQYTYKGVSVTKAQQKEKFVADFTKFVEESGGIEALTLPAELRAKIAENANVAAQFQALTMEMAFMDARMQEPSNRGLSDKDIEAALQRIGAFAANPLSFLQRQISLANRNLNSLTLLGEGWVATEFHTREEIIAAQYNPELVTRVRGALQDNLAILQEAVERVRATQLGATNATGPLRDGAPTPEELATIDDSTDEDFLQGF